MQTLAHRKTKAILWMGALGCFVLAMLGMTFNLVWLVTIAGIIAFVFISLILVTNLMELFNTLRKKRD
jgi:hypothetical protein